MLWRWWIFPGKGLIALRINFNASSRLMIKWGGSFYFT